MTTWQGHWVPLSIAGVLLLLALLMMLMTVLSFSRAATDEVYHTVDRLAAAADAAKSLRDLMKR